MSGSEGELRNFAELSAPASHSARARPCAELPSQPVERRGSTRCRRCATSDPPLLGASPSTGVNHGVRRFRRHQDRRLAAHPIRREPRLRPSVDPRLADDLVGLLRYARPRRAQHQADQARHGRGHSRHAHRARDRALDRFDQPDRPGPRLSRHRHRPYRDARDGHGPDEDPRVPRIPPRRAQTARRRGGRVHAERRDARDPFPPPGSRLSRSHRIRSRSTWRRTVPWRCAWSASSGTGSSRSGTRYRRYSPRTWQGSPKERSARAARCRRTFTRPR